MQFQYSPRRLFHGVALSRLTMAAAVLGAVIGGVVAFGVARQTGSDRGAPPPAVVPVIGPTDRPAAIASAGTGTAGPSRTASPRPSASVSASHATAAPSPTATATRLAPKAYEGDSHSNILAGGSFVGECSGCPDGSKVRYIGNGGTLTFPDVRASVAGGYTLTIAYTNGDTSGRDAVVTVDGLPVDVYFNTDGDWNSTQRLTMTVHLAAGENSIEFSNPGALGPDIAEIVV